MHSQNAYAENEHTSEPRENIRQIDYR